MCCKGPNCRGERFGFWFSSFARGPDTINGLFLSIALIGVLTLDSKCGADENGITSGADGQVCTPNEWWNNSWFNDTYYENTYFNGSFWNGTTVNGTACLAPDEFGAYYYENLQTPACQAAMRNYRARTADVYGRAGMTPGQFTCNCSSTKYAYLDSGLRPDVVIVVANTCALVVTLLVYPVFGSYIDTAGERRRIFGIMSAMTIVATLFSAILAKDYVWVVGCAGMYLTQVFYELTVIPVTSYLADIADDDPVVQGELAAIAQAMSLVSQIAIAVVIAALSFGIPASISWRTLSIELDPATPTPGVAQQTLVGIIGTVITSIWVAVFTTVAFRSLKPRPARPGAGGDGGGGGDSATATRTTSVCGRAFGGLWVALKELNSKYPVSRNYLIYHLFAAQGVNTIVPLSVSYLTGQIKLPAQSQLIIIAISLFTGTLSSFALVPLVKKVSLKWILLGNQIFGGIFVVVVPFILHSEGQFAVACIVGAIIGVIIGIYYSTEYAAFCSLIPHGMESRYSSLYQFARGLLSWLPPLIYTAILQGAATHKWALLHIVAYFGLGALLILPVDFKKGRKDAGLEVNSNKAQAPTSAAQVVASDAAVPDSAEFDDKKQRAAAVGEGASVEAAAAAAAATAATTTTTTSAASSSAEASPEQAGTGRSLSTKDEQGEEAV